MYFFLFLLTAIMSMVSIGASAHDFEVDGIYYNYNDGSSGASVSVTFEGDSFSSNVYSGEVIIPESVIYNGNTYCVTSIGDYAFHGCSFLPSIDIPNSVTSIDVSAFHGCDGLTSIIVEESNINYDSRNNCNAIIKKATNHLVISFRVILTVE